MFRRGDKVFLHDVGGHTIQDLEPRNYIVRFDPNQDEFYLQDAPGFTLPKKLYGEVTKYSDRFLKSFENWEGNLGVLLTGLKGTGKSLLARQTCMHSGMPVIMLSDPFSGPQFMSFLSHIPEKAILFLDEFEKVFNKPEHQHSLLSVLDGTFKSKILFLLTANDHTRITQYLNNRPGRIHYRMDFEGLEESVIREICEDKLENKEYTDQIFAVCTYVGAVSMDIVTKLIAEVNLYGIPPMEAMELMNLQPDSSNYSVKIFRDDKLVGETTEYGNPIGSKEIELEWYGPDIDQDELDPKVKAWNVVDLEKKYYKVTIKGTCSIVVTADHEEMPCKWVLVYQRAKRAPRNHGLWDVAL